MSNRVTDQHIEEVLHDRVRVISAANNCKAKKMQVLSRKNRAAVLICIFSTGPDAQLRVILTRRSINLSSHPGLSLSLKRFH